jgi:hypothetical protein
VPTRSSPKAWKPVVTVAHSMRHEPNNASSASSLCCPLSSDAVQVPVIAAGGIADPEAWRPRCSSAASAVRDRHRVPALLRSEAVRRHGPTRSAAPGPKTHW